MVVEQHANSTPTPAPTDDESLATLWRTKAHAISPRAIGACIALGALAIAAPLAWPRTAVLAALGVVVATFGLYAAVVRPSIGGRVLDHRTQRWVGMTLAAIAALAGIAAALLVLGFVFGGSLEVMRR